MRMNLKVIDRQNKTIHLPCASVVMVTGGVRGERATLLGGGI